MDKDQMSEATQLIADAGLNSLYLLELINDAEDEFGVQIDDEEIPQIVTIGDLMRLVAAKT
ncbi:MAG: acyl carrier protein [Oscillospiraceae bacterium]|nr:acyl carrier protein [Oscillospiraceae bacterium]